MMQIIDERENGTPYNEVNIGQVFTLDGNYYIKTNISEEIGTYDLLAINLATGERYPIGELVTVKLVNAQLIVR